MAAKHRRLRLCAAVLGAVACTAFPRVARATPPAAHAPPHAGRTGAQDAGARRSIAAGPTSDDVALGAESPELRALHDAEKELFPPAAPAPGSAWPSDLPYPLATQPDAPHVHASGLPPAPAANPLPVSDEGKSLAWIAQLTLPDLPVRWDARVVRYLEFFKDDPRGRATFSHLYRRSGRWGEKIRRSLQRKGLPQDLEWVSMIESGFDPTARSPVGAAGLWQFMPESGKSYGLAQDRWIDQRLDPDASTEAAADFLGDLHRRFGSWELALAAYDMGYGGMSAVVRRYNTNDFWVLSRLEGSMPWETTLYVPKILAVAVVAHNLAAFGFADLALDPPALADEVRVAPGTPLATVAAAAGCAPRDVESLNPELRAGRTPPDANDQNATYAVRVPQGKGAAATAALAAMRATTAPVERYVVRFGETLDQIAAARKTTVAKLVELNGIGAGEVVRGGTVLLVPKLEGVALAAPPAASPAQKTTVVVPADSFSYPDRRRVFYRVLVGDTLPEIASHFAVSVDDVRRWNALDAGARLLEGMTLQLYVRPQADLSSVVALGEQDVHVVQVGSDDFYAYLEGQRGHRRITVTAHKGETIEQIGQRYHVPAKSMERVNRRGRSEPLREGETVVLYVPGAPHAPTAAAQPAPPPPAPEARSATGSAPVPNLAPPPARAD